MLPRTRGCRVRDLIAEDLTTVAVAMREQANIWRAASTPGLETAIVTFGDFAELVAQRAHAYRNG